MAILTRLLLAILFGASALAAGCAAGPIQNPELQAVVARAAWAPIASAANGSILAVDQTSLQSSGDNIDTWIWGYTSVIGECLEALPPTKDAPFDRLATNHNGELLD